jgi:hypothetical protein
MAMRAARLLAVLAAVLALGSCQVLEVIFSSVFPNTIGLAKSQTDLSGQIAAGNGYAFRLRVVQSGGSGYVILIGTLSSSGITAYVYDLNLSPVTTLTGLASDGVMVDGGGYVVIGSQEYSPANLAPAGTTNGNLISSNGVTCGADAFANLSTQSANFSIPGGSSVVGYTTYAYPWAAGGTPRTATLSASVSNLRIDAVLDDGNPSGNVTLAVSQVSYGNGSSGETCWFVTTSKSNYSAGTVPANLLDSSPRLDHIDTGSIGFAQGSVMMYDSSAGRFLRIDPATGSTQRSFYSGADISSTRVAYLVSGGAFYSFDTNTRMLTRYVPWW